MHRRNETSLVSGIIKQSGQFAVLGCVIEIAKHRIFEVSDRATLRRRRFREYRKFIRPCDKATVVPKNGSGEDQSVQSDIALMMKES